MPKQEKPIKDKWLGARIDGALDAKISVYITEAEDLTMGLLVRRGVIEYMTNHPLKDENSKTDVNNVTKPGVTA